MSGENEERLNRVRELTKGMSVLAYFSIKLQPSSKGECPFCTLPIMNDFRSCLLILNTYFKNPSSFH